MPLISKLQINMYWGKSTKNCEVYYAEGLQSDPISQLYIKKQAFSGNAPETITVTVETAEVKD